MKYILTELFVNSGNGQPSSSKPKFASRQEGKQHILKNTKNENNKHEIATHLEKH